MAAESSQSGQVPPARQVNLASLNVQSPRSLSALEQLEAVRRLQEQAEKRLRLGKELFEATEAYITRYRQELEQLKQQQQELLQQMQKEIASSLRQYDQWIVRMEKDTTQRLEELTQRLTAMEAAWPELQKKVETLLRRSEAVLDQIRSWSSRLTVRKTVSPPQKVHADFAAQSQETKAQPPRAEPVRPEPVGSSSARSTAESGQTDGGLASSSSETQQPAESAEADSHMPRTIFTDLLKQMEQVRINLSLAQASAEDSAEANQEQPNG